MAHQIPEPKVEEVLRDFITGLRDTLTGPSATHSTDHWLSRLYAQGIVLLARTYYPGAVPNELSANGLLRFATGREVEPIAKEDPRAPEVDRTLKMDFENYTLGSLFRDRGNCNMNHSGHKTAVAQILGTVWSLGWRKSTFGTIDQELVWNTSRHDRARTERYGKKYGWIGFFNYAGILTDAGQLPENARLSDLGIDPSFPEPPVQAPVVLPVWARPTPSDDARWRRDGIIRVPDELLYCSDIGDHVGPWIAVHGHLNTKDQEPGRHVFGILNALLVAETHADRLVDALETRHYPGNWWLPEVPRDHYTFAGEIPWNTEFARSPLPEQLYCGRVNMINATPIEVEILAHRYACESYHSPLNKAGGALVPSRRFSEAFDLRSIPQSFNQTLSDCAVAAVSLGAPAGFEGNLLYLREDLVRQYAKRRRLVWFVWGERQLHAYPDSPPDWLIKVRQSEAQIWRYVRRIEELSPTFWSRPSKQTRREKRQSPTRK